ncbi:glycosyltransferase [Shewanella sp.]|uniref:glycosyltransferase n=1 Tax=Shewanella sp. TaxID=50422 RepID=UPI0040489FA4
MADILIITPLFPRKQNRAEGSFIIAQELMARKIGKVKKVRWRDSKVYFWKEVINLFHYINSSNRIIIHYPLLCLFPLIISPKEKLFIFLHGSDFNRYPTDSHLIRFCKSILRIILASKRPKIIAPSHSFAAQITSIIGGECDILPPDSIRGPVTRRMTTSQFGSGCKRLHIGGRDSWEKGGDTARRFLVEWGKSLLADGWQISSEICSDVGGVEYVGKQKRSSFLRLIGAADVYLCFSRSESYGLSVREAITLGTLPVIPRLPVFTEILYESSFVFHDNSTEDAYRIVKTLRKNEDDFYKCISAPVLPKFETNMANLKRILEV